MLPFRVLIRVFKPNDKASTSSTLELRLLPLYEYKPLAWCGDLMI